MSVLSSFIKGLQVVFDNLLLSDWIAAFISSIALTLSIVNAKMTWGKPFTFEFYPSLQGKNKENGEFLYIEFKATYFNSGSKAGLITDLALVQLDENKIVEKCPLIEIMPLTSSDIPITKPLNNSLYDKPIDHTFLGLFLEPQKPVKFDSTFRVVLQRKHSINLEKWNIAYRISSEDCFRLANVEIETVIVDEQRGQNISVGFRPYLHVIHKKYLRRMLVDTLPEIGVGLG